jgi:hypothetical protein
VARRSARKPTAPIITDTCAGFTPASKTQHDQLARMREAAVSLRRANDPAEDKRPTGRAIRKGGAA